MNTSGCERSALVAAALAAHSDYLLRVARSRVGDDFRAQEAVQDTMLAALESAGRFEGRAQLRTWLTGILLHKIHDGYRKAARDRAVPWDEDAPDEREELRTPEHELHLKQVRGAFLRALGHLPKRQADAFVLREVSGLATGEICRRLGVTRANLWVLIHRARAGLRSALEHEGFAA